MPLDPQTEPNTRPKQYCALCMGMVLFTSNENQWRLDVCDECGQITKVKDELRNDEDKRDTSRPMRSGISRHRNLEERKHGGFWKRIEKIVVALSA